MRNPFTRIVASVKNMFHKEHNSQKPPTQQPISDRTYGKANSDLNQQRNLFLRALSGLKSEKKAVKNRKRTIPQFGTFSAIKPFRVNHRNIVQTRKAA